MRFVIIRSESMIVIDNADLHLDCSSLPANVEIVVYQEIEGKVEYNDRPSVRTRFTDPSPYQTLLNSWMTAAAALAPPLQLDQAKQIKIDLVEAIFHHKRRLPFISGPWQYDARDESVANLEVLIRGTSTVGSSSSGLIANINVALSTITGQINSVHSNITSWSGSMNTNFSQMNFLTSNAANIDMLGCINAYIIGGATVTISGSGSSPGPGPGSGAAQIAGASVSGSVTTDLTYAGNITMMPLNATTPQTIAASTVNTAIQGIASRRNTLNNDRLTKEVAINALTTIAQVVAYDATAGWSS
jgi:hypothetical protein